VASEAGMLPALNVPTTRQGNQALARQADGAAHFGEGGKQQVGPHGQVRFHTEEENEDGVINEPPPTPVKPTMRPTANPAKMKAMSCMAATVVKPLHNPNYIFAIHIFLLCMKVAPLTQRTPRTFTRSRVETGWVSIDRQ
jgi:hypothetical protein